MDNLEESNKTRVAREGPSQSGGGLEMDGQKTLHGVGSIETYLLASS